VSARTRRSSEDIADVAALAAEVAAAEAVVNFAADPTWTGRSTTGPNSLGSNVLGDVSSRLRTAGTG
jgi:hypothetical protein